MKAAKDSRERFTDLHRKPILHQKMIIIASTIRKIKKIIFVYLT